MTDMKETDFPPLEPQPFVTEEGREIGAETVDLAAAIKQRDGYLEGNRQTLRALQEANEIAARYKAERDEARRRCCVALMGTGVWRQPRMDLPGGSWTPQLIAKELGWDCFEKEVKR